MEMWVLYPEVEVEKPGERNCLNTLFHKLTNRFDPRVPQFDNLILHHILGTYGNWIVTSYAVSASYQLHYNNRRPIAESSHFAIVNCLVPRLHMSRMSSTQGDLK